MISYSVLSRPELSNRGLKTHVGKPLQHHHHRSQQAHLVQKRYVLTRSTEKQYVFDDEIGHLSSKIDEYASSVSEGLQGTSIFLIGMMGSGKTTTGKMLANVLKYYFFDSDSVIEEVVGAKVTDIFAENGEEGFREMEQSVLSELSSYRSCVIATGGGVVTRPQNWGSMQVGVTVYLQGNAELLASRVLNQDGGASRPLLAGQDGAGSPEATTKNLSAILKEREASYRQADCIVSLSGRGQTGASAPEVVLRVLTSIDEKIKSSAKEREERKKFEIKYEQKDASVDANTTPKSQAKSSKQPSQGVSINQPES